MSLVDTDWLEKNGLTKFTKKRRIDENFYSQNNLIHLFDLNGFKKDAINIGTTIQTSEGINKYVINFRVVTLFAIHNIVVVTSPIGDQAPPAFAAMIIIPRKNHLSF